MALMLMGIVLFAGTHLFSSLLPGVRDRLKAWLGEGRFKGAYAMISLVGIVLMGWGYVQARGDGQIYYVPAEWARHVTMLLVLLAFVLLASGRGNNHFRLWLQHPFSTGVALWAVGHLLANGKVPVVWIALTMLAVAIADIVSSLIRKPKLDYTPEFASTVRAVIAGAVIYAVFLLGFHPYILGVPILR